jgi:GNAT superfamily N-acetyltransferase
MSLWRDFVREDWGGAALIGNALVPIPFRNHVALVRSQPKDAAALITHASDFYRALGAPPAFQLDSETTPTDLPAMLVNAGYSKQVEAVWMLCQVDDTPVSSIPSDVEIKQLTPDSPASWIQAYIDCYNISFRAPAHVHTGFGESFRSVLPNPTGLHFIGLLDGEPAGAVTLFHDAGLGGVYNVGTFPTMRGQGVAGRLLFNLLTVARQLGLERLLLQTVHHGPAQPLYERVGFRTHFVRDWYLPRAPGGIWS